MSPVCTVRANVTVQTPWDPKEESRGENPSGSLSAACLLQAGQAGGLGAQPPVSKGRAGGNQRHLPYRDHASGEDISKSEQLRATQIPHLRHSRAGGNPSPARCVLTTPEAVCHPAHSNQVVNLGANTVLDTPQNACAILNPERELQPCPLSDNPLSRRDSGAEPAGTMSRIDTPALDARQRCGADCDAARAVRPREDVRTPLQPNKWRRPTPRGGMPMAFPMPLPSLPFGLAHGSSVAAGSCPPWPWEGVSIGL